MNRINPEKLLMYKWSAIHSTKKERHFIVTKLIRAADGIINTCELEAVINKKVYEIDWHILKEPLIKSGRFGLRFKTIKTKA